MTTGLINNPGSSLSKSQADELADLNKIKESKSPVATKKNPENANNLSYKKSDACGTDQIIHDNTSVIIHKDKCRQLIAKAQDLQIKVKQEIEVGRHSRQARVNILSKEIAICFDEGSKIKQDSINNPELQNELKRNNIDIDEIQNNLMRLSIDVRELISQINAIIEAEEKRFQINIAYVPLNRTDELIREARINLEKLFDALILSLQRKNSAAEAQKIMEKIRIALQPYLLKEIAFDRLFPLYTEMNAIDNLLVSDSIDHTQMKTCINNCKNQLSLILGVNSEDTIINFLDSFLEHLKKVFQVKLSRPSSAFSSQQA